MKGKTAAKTPKQYIAQVEDKRPSDVDEDTFKRLIRDSAAAGWGQ
jgi:hypothetical protein